MNPPVLDTRQVLLGHLLAKVTPLCSTKLLAKEILLEIANNLPNKEIIYLLENDKALVETVHKSKAHANEKEELGEELFSRISCLEPDLCAKITGMLLELDTVTIKSLLSSQTLLEKAVDKSKREYIDFVNQCVRKEELGEDIYEVAFSRYQNSELSSRLTGMLLELPLPIIESILKDPEDLNCKLEQARQTLFKWMASQQELSDFIKGVHVDLRLRAREIGGEEAWQSHSKNTDVLKKYASAMEELAKSHWDKKNPALNRIYWVVSECDKYFFGSGFQDALSKEMRLFTRFFPNETSPNWPRPFKAPLKMLDVGSCYNPFKKFEVFDVTALDLCPASADVIQCDFLTENLDRSALRPESFDVVVFSLLLEYMPEPRQRFECCLKAERLLKPLGALVILTPDSKHATANSKIMKHWKHALAGLGFLRSAYQKMRHLHCMLYYKCAHPGVPRKWLSFQPFLGNPQNLMVIPQDSNTYSAYSAQPQPKRKRDLDNNIAETFSILPSESLY